MSGKWEERKKKREKTIKETCGRIVNDSQLDPRNNTFPFSRREATLLLSTVDASATDIE